MSTFPRPSSDEKSYESLMSISLFFQNARGNLKKVFDMKIVAIFFYNVSYRLFMGDGLQQGSLAPEPKLGVVAREKG